MDSVTWAIVGLTGLADCLIFANSGFSLRAEGETAMLLAVAFCCAIWFVYSRLRPTRTLAAIGKGAAQLLLAANGMGLFSYLLPGIVHGRLLDADLANLDRALGFDWVAVHAFFTRSSGLVVFSRLLYFSSGPQMLILLIVLNLCRDYARADELVFGFALTALFCVLIGAAFPAAGAFEWYAVPEMKSRYVVQYLGIRNGSLRELDLYKLQGIVQFPSFHAALSGVYIYVTRSRRWLFAATLMLNLALIAVIPSVGGHHFVDVLAGLMLDFAVAVAIFWLGPGAAGRRTAGSADRNS